MLSKLGSTKVPDILIRDVANDAIEELRAGAKRNGRSLQSELKIILESEAEARRKRRDFARRAALLSQTFPPQTTDSTDLIREDRDTEHGRDE